MAMHFEELDNSRDEMLIELNAELEGPMPYFGLNLSTRGRAAFPDLMRDAVRAGNEISLSTAIGLAEYWNQEETYTRAGVTRMRQVNILQASDRLAITEFNTWYVRGLSGRLKREGVTRCQAYRAAIPKWEPGECNAHEGETFDVELIYRGHRARYWPAEDLTAISIPFAPGCHHTIRRI